MRHGNKIIVLSGAILTGVAAGIAEAYGLRNTCSVFMLLSFTVGSIGLMLAFMLDDTY